MTHSLGLPRNGGARRRGSHHGDPQHGDSDPRVSPGTPLMTSETPTMTPLTLPPLTPGSPQRALTKTPVELSRTGRTSG